MGPNGVVIPAPGLDNVLGVPEATEPVDARAFVVELAVEAFDERVIDGFVRSNAPQCHSTLMRLEIERLARELETVVTDSDSRQAAFGGVAV